MKLTFDTLNRKLHIHLGLFLLLFIWLFSLSGLILNHGSWKFASFWDEREEVNVDFTLPLSALALPDVKSEVMRFLDVKGEVQGVSSSSENLKFRITAPGIVRDVNVDLKTGIGTIKVLKFNFWGKFRTLHTFNGIDKGNPLASPNWLVANIWRYAMDAIALGLILICISSWMMWYKIRKEYRFGLLTLITGFAIAGYFVFG